jgi:hypothetical protein
MAQYPQGIFQSLQFLLKRVKILALQKQPTYIGISTLYEDYTLPGRGIYQIVEVGSTGDEHPIYFPNASFCNGETIIINNIAPGEVGQFIQGVLPCNKSGATFDTLASNTYYTFVSINDKWVGGQLT